MFKYLDEIGKNQKKVRGHLVKVKMVIFIFGCVILLTIYKYLNIYI